MKFFLGKSKKRNRQEERIVNCSEIFVAKTTIYSSFLDPHGGGPLTLEKYFLVTEKDGKYFELFSGVEIKKESDIHSNGFAVSFKNTPYIESSIFTWWNLKNTKLWKFIWFYNYYKCWTYT